MSSPSDSNSIDNKQVSDFSTDIPHDGMTKASAKGALQGISDSSLSRANQTVSTASFMPTLLAIEKSSIMKSIRAIEDSPVMKSIRAINSSPTMESLRAMGESLRPLRIMEDGSFKESLRSFSNSSALESLRAMGESTRPLRIMEDSSFRKSLEAFGGSSVIESLRTIGESVKTLRIMNDSSLGESLRAFENSSIMKSLRAIDGSTFMKSLHANEGISILQDLINTTGRITTQARSSSSFQEFSKAIARADWLIADEALLNDIKLENDGVILDRATALTKDEIHNLVTQVTENAINTSNQQLLNFISNLQQEIRSLKTSKLEKFITIILIPIIMNIAFSFLNPIFDTYVRKSINENERQLQKEIKRIAATTISRKTPIDNYRFISKEYIIIRKNPSARSQRLGEIHFGAPVIVIKKKKNWTLIAREDQTSETSIQGWVFSRYLKKFR